MDFPGELSANTATSGRISVGQTATSQLETAFDEDWFRIRLEAGQSYEFTLEGTGGSSALSDPYLRLYRNGVEVAQNDDSGNSFDSRITFTATETGSYFLEAAAYSNETGEYRLGANEIADLPPPLQGGPVLSSIDWGGVLEDSSVNVYFATAGRSFAGFTSAGWSSYEIQQTMAVLDEISSMVDLTFNRVTSTSNADFNLVTQNNAAFSGLMIPPGEPDAGVGVFARNAPGWDGSPGGGLEQGGGGYQLLLHELGHGLGLAHPHDNGGTSDIMLGVSSDRGDYGAFDLNQAVFTNMSYNDGMPAEGAGPHSSNTYGYTGTLSPLDIAALQERYGAVSANEGDTIYELDGTNGAGTFFAAIWDTGGTDWIEHNGTRDSTIDLRAATLRYEEGGGGFVSRADNVRGGFTIAHGVVIENARGSSGDDLINGNSRVNELHGEGGEDELYGFRGDDALFGGGGTDALYGGADDDILDGGAAGDTLDGGGGFDTASYASATRSVTVDLQIEANSRNDASGDEFTNIEAVAGSEHADILRGDEDANILFGSEGDDRLAGRSGDDVLEGGAGADRLMGGGDFDTASYASSDSRIVADMAVISNNTGDAAGDTYSDIQALLGSDHNDTLRGDTEANLLTGGIGDDILSGRGGDDVFIGGVGADRLNGGSGLDTAEYSSAAAAVRVDLLRNETNTGEAAGDRYDSIEGLVGSVHDDQLRGTNEANTIVGGGGNDVLVGRAGADTLFGGGGDDIMNGGRGVDTFVFAELDGTSDRINSFEAAKDIVAFDADLGLTFADLDLSDVADGVNVTFGAANEIFLRDVSVAQISESNFDFDFMA